MRLFSRCKKKCSCFRELLRGLHNGVRRPSALKMSAREHSALFPRAQSSPMLVGRRELVGARAAPAPCFWTLPERAERTEACRRGLGLQGPRRRGPRRVFVGPRGSHLLHCSAVALPGDLGLGALTAARDHEVTARHAHQEVALRPRGRGHAAARAVLVELLVRS